MISDLADALKAILSANGLPTEVVNADISFDRPSDTYNPPTTTINLFLYDIRENADLRSNEPVIERQGGIATIHRPPVRVACSYLVTAWIGAEATGEEAILRQHELLGEVLRVFAGMPTIPPERLTGALASQPYPIPLAVLQTDLVRNPAEFWSALGGKLRPSFTLTATLALEALSTPVTAPEVSTKKVVIRDTTGGTEELLYEIGGTVRSAETGAPLSEAEVTIPALGRRTLTDADGRYTFGGLAAEGIAVEAARSGYTTVTVSFQVPGTSSTVFDIDLPATP